MKNIKLNFLKGLACMGVVFIHVTFPGLFGQIVLRASAYAVPIFYMIAGYYAYGIGSEDIERRLKKIVKIFLCAYSFFFLCNLTFSIKDHEVLQWLSLSYNWMTPLKYICFCTINFAIPLWYLIAMIETYIVWLLVLKKQKEHLVIKMLPILFLFQIILTFYCETMDLEWFWKMNFLAQAMPWFVLGYYLNTEAAQILHSIKTSFLLVLIIVGSVIAVIPTALDLPLKFNVIGYIPYAFGLFALTLKNPSKSICRPVEFIGDKLSLYIYIIHAPLARAVGFSFRNFLNVNTLANPYLMFRPIIVLLITLIMAWIIYKVKMVALREKRRMVKVKSEIIDEELIYKISR